MSDEMNQTESGAEEPKNGEVLVQYSNDEDYNLAYTGFNDDLSKLISFANENTDWREIRKRLADTRDKLKSLFLKENDIAHFNEIINNLNDSINQRQTEEQEKFEAESQANFDSVIGEVNETVEFAVASSDFKLSREKLLAAQDSFKNLKLKRSHRDELYRLINNAFDNVSKNQNEFRENYEMECIDNYHKLKQKIDAAVEFAQNSEIFAEARKSLINVQNQIKGLKLKREQRDELYQTIRDAFDGVNVRQENERKNFESETTSNYDTMKKTVGDAIAFTESSEDYGQAREQLINAQNQIKAVKLKREQRDELFAEIRAVFDNLNQKQSSERETYEAECNQNYEKLTEKVNGCFELVHGLTEFNMIRESLITVQGEVRIARLKKDQRNELFARIREAFSLFDKKKNEYFEQKKDEKTKKLHDIKLNLEEKITRLSDILAKDNEALDYQKSKLSEAAGDEFLTNEINSKIDNINGRIKEKEEVIGQTKARISEIEEEINQK